MPASAAAEKEQPATRFAKDQLKAFIERIERLEEEKKATSDDIRDVYAEAKGTGFDTALPASSRIRISTARSGCFLTVSRSKPATALRRCA